jgi:large subunit ribosomal protein L19
VPCHSEQSIVPDESKNHSDCQARSLAQYDRENEKQTIKYKHEGFLEKPEEKEIMNKQAVLKSIEAEQIKGKPAEFGPGDTVKVQVKVIEGDKERLQAFQGVVIQRRGSGIGTTFTVRKISGGVGVERIFPLYSPNIAKITVVKRGAVRRAKLFYLRGLTGKAAKVAQRHEAAATEAPAGA